ncbi:MAG: murein transglycosylase domain-containing protein [Syntrophales bacterium]|nr:murein transglycosylase domain-containing protein [Syntrophales bacterium]
MSLGGFFKPSKILILLAVLVLLFACSSGEIARVARVAATGDSAAAGRMAAERAARYALQPEKIGEDLRRVQAVLDRFRRSVDSVWGKEDSRESSQVEYVKYTQNYLSRASVDFNLGIITVETIDQENPLTSLRNAVVTTILTPDDPRAVDLYSAGEVPLGGEPFLLGLVKDFDGHDIRWSWRAERFADLFIQNHLNRRTGAHEGGDRIIHYVTINMVPNHRDIRARKYQSLVERYADEFSISRTLVYAIMRTESSFNPYAVSRSQALGLMQVMPSTAGRDVYRMLNGQDGIPSREFLMNPENNIRYGVAYLNILWNRYLNDIKDELSREYCTIAAYNAGAGAVLLTFDKDRNRAPSVINGMPPLDVFNRIKNEIPKEEARQYIVRVLNAKRDFVNF